MNIAQILAYVTDESASVSMEESQATAMAIGQAAAEIAKKTGRKTVRLDEIF